MTARHHRTEVQVGGPQILGQNRAGVLELLLTRGRCTTHMRCVDACPFWEHAKRALLIAVSKRARLHAMSVGITTLAVLESHHRRLAAEVPGQGLDGGRVGVLKGVQLPIMAEECFDKRLDVPGMPRLGPLPVDMVEGTWVGGESQRSLTRVIHLPAGKCAPVFRMD